MLDIHTHIIPGVDDGSKNIETSLEMIEREIEDGVDEIIFTPHSYCHGKVEKEKILESFNELDKILKEKQYNIKYYLGQEIYYEKDTKQRLKNNEYLTINNSKYILVEFDYYITLDELSDIIYSIRLIGYEPIIAHIERYNIKPKEYYILKKSTNVLLQMNAEFVLSNKRVAKKMIKDKIVDYIASDCHSMNRRSPNLGKIKKIINKYSHLNINRFN